MIIDRNKAIQAVSAALRNDPLRRHTDLTDEQLALDCRVFAAQIVDALFGEFEERISEAVANTAQLDMLQRCHEDRAQLKLRLRDIEEAAREVVGAYTVFNDRPMNRLKAILSQKASVE